MITINQAHPSDLLYKEQVGSRREGLLLRIEALKSEGIDNRHLEVAEELLAKLDKLEIQRKSQNEYLLGLSRGTDKEMAFLAGCLLDRDWRSLAI